MHRHRSSPPRSVPTRTLLPGEYYCERAPLYLGTVLGSCVAVCLWDQHLRFGGMNHFILPNRPSNGELSFRFGDVAVPELINRMVSLGSNVRHLQAKLFGGAYVLRAGSPEYAVGRRNVEIAVAELRARRIPVMASRLSGTRGLVIRQCTECGDVWVRPVGNIEKGPQLTDDVRELPCFEDDISAGMVIRDEDGMPVALRTRRAGSNVTDCQTCTGSPLAWRRL